MTKTVQKPVILTLGVTGQLGKIVADHLLKDDSVSFFFFYAKRLAKMKEFPT